MIKINLIGNRAVKGGDTLQINPGETFSDWWERVSERLFEHASNDDGFYEVIEAAFTAGADSEQMLWSSRVKSVLRALDPSVRGKL